MASIGDQLLNLVASSTEQLIIVSPFIKTNALARLVQILSDEVDLVCVTRWRPDEIALGVSDIQIWEMIRERPNSSLWIRSDLHAKFYRADNRCLAGSANLTLTALGWVPNPNYELLVSVPYCDPAIQAFEENLFIGSVMVDDDLYRHTWETIQYFLESHYKQLTAERSEHAEESTTQSHITVLEAWIPTLRNPENLYIAYKGEWDSLTVATQEAAFSDLQALSIDIAALSLEKFRLFIGALLLQKPIIRKVDQFVTKPQRFGAVRGYLRTLPCANIPGFDATIAWQTLMRWLLYFLPNRYKSEVPHHSEIFSRR